MPLLIYPGFFFTFILLKVYSVARFTGLLVKDFSFFFNNFLKISFFALLL